MTTRVRPTLSPPIRRTIGLIAAAAALASSCGVDAGVSSIGAAPTQQEVDADQAGDTSATTPPVSTVEPDDSDGGSGGDVTDNTNDVSDAANTTDAPPPPTTVPAITEPILFADIAIADVINVGSSKPDRDYDEFVAVAHADVERWWSEQFPAIYDAEFVPLEGGTFAGYPGRDDAVPGCGESTTRYPDLNLFVAFYCEQGDFMVYDDGDDSLLTALADEFGPAVLGVVIAHEYGHAIQGRIGLLDRPIATIFTEQQADCFAGAWTGQTYRGESPLLQLSDADVRTGLIAMLSVRDPVGTSQFQAGGHGSAFDRVGAFQEGFVAGPARCAELIDQPLTLMPNEFQSQGDFERGGNASYDCSDDPSPDCSPASEFLATDLNDFWATALDGFEPLAPNALPGFDQLACSEPTALASEVTLCLDERQVAYDEPAVLDLYREFGDFTLGYFYGIAWAEAVQTEIGSPLVDEDRALLNDCFTGAWVRDITPDDTGLTPRARDTDGDGVPEGIQSSPGDLDEAIRMAIIVGDVGANVDRVGSPFEKIGSFRTGVLGGLDACTDLLPG